MSAVTIDIIGIQRLKVDKFLPISGQIPLYKWTNSFHKWTNSFYKKHFHLWTLSSIVHVLLIKKFSTDTWAIM